MANHVETDISVQGFAFSSDDTGSRLTFPHAETKAIEGRSGTTNYGASECVFDKLEGRLDTFRWGADSASLGSAWMRDDAGRFELSMARIEMPSGIVMARADKGVELLAPHVSLSDFRADIHGPFGTPPTIPVVPSEELRQGKLRFLDSLSGHINLTIKVVLDLPVLGKRTLDQKLEVPVQEGSLDFRALEDSLDWLEGRFIDIEPSDGRLAVSWKVPVFGKEHDLVSFALDQDAGTLVSFGRVPVRALADFRVGGGGKSDGKRKSKILQSFSLDAIDIALSLLAPRSVETGTGLIMFGGDDEPGMVDLQVTGRIGDSGPGTLKGRIGSVDTTIKDVGAGPIHLTADRLHFDGIDELEVTFDGFRPSNVRVVVHRVTATNLDVKIGGR